MCNGKQCSTCEKRLTCSGCPDKVVFSDVAVLDKKTKTLLSVRDGVYEYLGAEIGMEPAHKIFKIYRSPETVKQLATMMNDIPMTDGHVGLDKYPEEVLTTITETEVVENLDENLNSTIIIKNKIANIDSMVELNQQGKNELSLGFKANLIEHANYDFEQTEIEPHHLAILERGRCGSACRFIDKQGIKETPVKKLFQLMKQFKDEEMTLQQLMEMVAALPEAIKTVPMEELQKLAPALKEIIAVAQAAGIEVVEEVEEIKEVEENPTEEMPAEEEKPAEEEMPATDEEMTEEEKLAMADGILLFNDAQVKTAIASAVKLHSDTIEHARKFVDQDFDFSGKTTMEIQKEVVSKVAGNEFEDSAEIAIAFKLLKPGSMLYKEFGDKSPDEKFDSIKNKEIS